MDQGPAAGSEAALWNLLVQQIGVLCSVFVRAFIVRGREVICNMRRKIGSFCWHFPHDPPAMWSWWKSWRKSVSRWTDTRLQVVQQCRRLVRLGVQRLIHGRWLGRTWLRRQRWLMVRGWRRIGTIFGWLVERVRSILVVSAMLPSYHFIS